jgi:hypothetical protein
MGSTSSTPTQPPPTPASSFFNLTYPVPRPRKNTPTNSVVFPRRSIFAPDENEPDDLYTSPHDGVLLGWTRTEQGIIIPQIRSLPIPTPLDDTIFNSPRLTPWVERTRARSPVPSARSIHQMRQFSFESLQSATKRELRVINVSRPSTAKSMEQCLTPAQYADRHDVDGEEDNGSSSAGESFDWDAFPDPIEELTMYGEEDQTLSSVSLKRGNSTNDSGYSTMVADTGSYSDISEDPWWWEEAAGYSENIYGVDEGPLFTTGTAKDAARYLHKERQESAYISDLLRNQPFDEWAEWRSNVTKLLMIPEEQENQVPRPVTPVPAERLQKNLPPTPHSPLRRRSLLNYAKSKTKMVLSKRKSLLW